MSTQEATYVAEATLKDGNWTWLLRVDDVGLYRWYLRGDKETHIRASTQAGAEAALQRYVKRTFRGELVIEPVQS